MELASEDMTKTHSVILRNIPIRLWRAHTLSALPGLNLSILPINLFELTQMSIEAQVFP